MIIIAVLGILFAGFACAGMSFVGARSFVKSHDWHHAVGAELYFLSAGFFLWAGKERRKLWKFLRELKFIFS